jgi:hypothetical protein
VILTCFRFLAICCFHVNLLSIVIPRYLISVFRGIWISLMVNVRCWTLPKGESYGARFIFIYLIHYFSNQVCRVLRWCWRSDAALLASSFTYNMTVSSANVPRVVLAEVGRSDVYRTYKDGPRTLPWILNMSLQLNSPSKADVLLYVFHRYKSPSTVMRWQWPGACKPQQTCTKLTHYWTEKLRLLLTRGKIPRPAKHTHIHVPELEVGNLHKNGLHVPN